MIAKVNLQIRNWVTGTPSVDKKEAPGIQYIYIFISSIVFCLMIGPRHMNCTPLHIIPCISFHCLLQACSTDIVNSCPPSCSPIYLLFYYISIKAIYPNIFLNQVSFPSLIHNNNFLFVLCIQSLSHFLPYLFILYSKFSCRSTFHN